MPASLFHENQEQINHNIQNSNVNVNGLEEQRALQLALELSMLGLMNDEDAHLNTAIDVEARLKKSQNTTECVPVPSSEHVAEIVGRQGCKIKALRAKTNTYIKTPVRGEEPVFVVTGRKEDVNSAKREILSAAEHFSQIRAQRKNTLGSVVGGVVTNLNGTGNGLVNNVCNATGQCTIQVRVPYRVVGLVVGPKGATIKRIQQQTSTYIITPSREKEPIFEVTGLPDNVQTARKEIEAHIAIRTGDVIDSCSSGNGSSQADDLEARDFLSNSPHQFGNFVEQLYGNATVTSNGLNNVSNVAAVASKLNGLQLLQQVNNNTNGTNSNLNANNFSSMFGNSGLSALGNNLNGNVNVNNGLSNLYSSTKSNTKLENSFNPFNLNNLNGSSGKPDLVENGNSNMFNFGVDNLNRNNLLSSQATNSNNTTTNGNSTLNSMSSASSSSSASSNGNLNSNNSLLNLGNNNSLCNVTGGLNMLNLQNAKNLLNANSKFADIYSQLLANNGNLTSNINNKINSNYNHQLNHQLLQQHQKLNNGLSTHVNNSSKNGNLSTNNANNLNTTSNTNNLLNSNSNGNSNNLTTTNNNAFNVSALYERDEGIGDSPTFDSIAAANLATLTNNLALIANSNVSNHSSNNSSGIGSSNGLINLASNGNCTNNSSSSSVNSTNSNSMSLWPDFSNSSNNSNTNGSTSTPSSLSTIGVNASNSSLNNVTPNGSTSLTTTSISTAQQQVSRA